MFPMTALVYITHLTLTLKPSARDEVDIHSGVVARPALGHIPSSVTRRGFGPGVWTAFCSSSGFTGECTLGTPERKKL